MCHLRRWLVTVQDLAAFSWTTLALVSGVATNQTEKLASADGRILENTQIKVEIAENGTLAITDKTTQETVTDLLVFENVGDIANEYIFMQPKNDQAILSSDVVADLKVVENHADKAVVKVTHVLEIPVSADELLDIEQQMVIGFTGRKAGRSKETAPLTIETFVTVHKDSKKVDFETRLNNQTKDHRLRVLFPTALQVETHEADSIYEIVERPNQVSPSWENPTNPQRQHAFANLHDATRGVTVGNFGLNEYEIVDDTIAVTLLRCVRELGDWGYFPTPEAQCLGEHTFNYSVELHGTPETRYETYKHAYTAQVPFTVAQVAVQSGAYLATYHYVKVESETFVPTALKRRKADQALILRGYNMSDEVKALTIEKAESTPVVLNLLEEATEENYVSEIQPYEIRTIGLMN